MFSFFNQFSFLITVLVLGVGLAFGLWRWRKPPRWLKLLLVAGYVLLAGAIHLSVHYTPASIDTVEGVEATLVNGHSTFVMLYSDY